MLIYHFKVGKRHYAYALLKDAEAARRYFTEGNYPKETITEIEHVEEEERCFQFKMAFESSRGWRD